MFFGAVIFMILSVVIYKYILPNFKSTIDIEIFKNFEVDSDAEILIKYNKENEVKISSMKRIEVKVVPHNTCYEKSI